MHATQPIYNARWWGAALQFLFSLEPGSTVQNLGHPVDSSQLKFGLGVPMGGGYNIELMHTVVFVSNRGTKSSVFCLRAVLAGTLICGHQFKVLPNINIVGQLAGGGLRGSVPAGGFGALNVRFAQF